MSCVLTVLFGISEIPNRVDASTVGVDQESTEDMDLISRSRFAWLLQSVVCSSTNTQASGKSYWSGFVLRLAGVTLYTDIKPLRQNVTSPLPG